MATPYHHLDLCLACSSSLPPLRSPASSADGRASRQGVFRTSCCSRPICPACLSSNPRLARYNPCLQCLGGVAAVSRRNVGSGVDKPILSTNVNINGAVRDEDTFIVGDDDDDIPAPPPGDNHSPNLTISNEKPDIFLSEGHDPPVSVPLQYHIQPRDTLQGIALKFGVDARELCRLNKLPPSALNITPHILHTRTVITLPPSLQQKTERPLHREVEHRRARERAEKRLQTLTKELDRRVAKAYVSLADDPDDASEYEAKLKESGEHSNCRPLPEEALGERAIRRYLDDQEWEEAEIREGRGVRIPNFPGICPDARSEKAAIVSGWWRRKT